MSLFVNVGDAVGLVVFALALLWAIYQRGRALWLQRNCKHEFYCETNACEAICRQCGKNLGFIGAWRAKLAGKTKEG